MASHEFNGHFYYKDDNFYLRPLNLSDIDGPWFTWLNDPQVTQFQLKGYKPNSKENQRQYFLETNDSPNDVILGICLSDSDEHVGCVGLHAIDPIHSTAVLGIIIGEKSAWGRGIGKGAWQAITNYGFEVLNLRKICATVFDGNARSLKCAFAAGFVVEGTQIEQIYKNGKFLDLIHLGLLRSSWQARRTRD